MTFCFELLLSYSTFHTCDLAPKHSLKHVCLSVQYARNQSNHPEEEVPPQDTTWLCKQGVSSFDFTPGFCSENAGCLYLREHLRGVECTCTSKRALFVSSKRARRSCAQEKGDDHGARANRA